MGDVKVYKNNKLLYSNVVCTADVSEEFYFIIPEEKYNLYWHLRIYYFEKCKE